MIREEIILKYVKNKEILDIGSVGQTDAYHLWDMIKKEAKEAKGIDIKPSNDPNVVQGNMENYNFNKKFDVIIAGDVLEHVDNQGLFLSNIHKHLRNNGKFILTTPNAKWITVLITPNNTHMLWHDKYTLTQLLKRHGLRIIYFTYYNGNKKHYNFIKKIITKKQQMLAVCERI